MEKGYEDIYSDEPYIDIDYSQPCAYIDLIYVPPHKRGLGEGKRLVDEFLGSIPKEIERVRLKSCALATGPTKEFWESFGFKQAYYGDLDGPDGDLSGIMVLGVNGHETPPPEKLTEHNNERETFESKEDIQWVSLSKERNLEFSM